MEMIKIQNRESEEEMDINVAHNEQREHTPMAMLTEEVDTAEIDEIMNQQDFFVPSLVQQRNMSVKFMMNLKEFHGVRESSANAVVIGVDNFVRTALDTIHQKVNDVLEDVGLRPELIPALKQQFDHFILPFDGLQTKYDREKYIHENFFVVEPEEVVLGEQLKYFLRNKQRVLDIKEDKFRYIPMDKSIEQLLQNKDIFQLVFSSNHTYFDNSFYCDVTDGSIFREHPLFSIDNTAMRIMLYFDDIEICNPLGKKAGVHKLGVFYYTLVNFPVQYRSRLPLIRLLAIVRRRNIKRCGMNIILKRIKEDLISLAQGVPMILNDKKYVIKGALLGFSGDTLAAHEFAGFKEGVGFAYQKCRHCECTFDDMQVHCCEKDFI